MSILKAMSMVGFLFIGLNIESSEGTCKSFLRVRYALPNEFPFLAQLGYRDRESVYCSASILNERHVLTSNQCIEKDVFHTAVVIVGSIIFSKPTDLEDNVYEAEKYFISDMRQYDIFNGLDLAIVKVKKDICFTDSVKPIPLRIDGLIEGDCVGIGYGIPAPVQMQCSECFSPVLKVITLPFIKTGKCREKFSELGTKLLPGVMCAGYFFNGGDACKGDPGGPLVCDGDLTGIIASRDGCARIDAPGIFTNVSAFIDWIDSSMEKDDQKVQRRK